MNREQAYEKLELPVGTDLQVVQQQFNKMHNDFRVQIDGAFNEEIRQRKQQQFAELEEAFKLLMDSDSTDISRSTPYTGKTFDHTAQQPAAEGAPKENKQQASPPPPPQEEKGQPQEQAPPVYTTAPAKQKSNAGLFIGIAAAVIVVLAGFYFLSDRNGNPDSPTATTNLRQDSTLWKTTLLVNSEEAYQLYLDEYPKGIFAQVANDSLARLNERATAEAAELAKTEEQQAERDVAQKPVEQQAPNQVPTPATIRKEEANPKVDVNWKANYDKVTRADFSYDFFVIKNGKEGYVSKDGKVIIPPIYDELTWKVSRRESRIVGVKDGKEGLIDYSSGKELTSFIYSHIGKFQDGLADFKLSGTDKGYIDVNGKEVIPPIYTNAGSFAGGFAYVTNKAYQYGVIDKKGNIVVPFGKYKKIEPLRYSIDNYPVPKRFIAQLPDGEWILINEKDEFLRKTDENFLEPGMASYR